MIPRRSISIAFLPALLLSALLLAGPALGAAPGDPARNGLARIEKPPLGLPPVPVPPDNAPTMEKVELGRKLFFDIRLSGDGTLSCAICHLPENGFAVNGLPTAVGKNGARLRRNAPTVLNAAYAPSLFRDGRAASLEAQALGPLTAPDEMANPSPQAMVERIRGLPEYDGLFERAFGGGPTPERIVQAIATYERTLLAGDSPFDRWFYGGDETALSEGAQRGFELFRGKAHCSLCHLIGEDTALFTDDQFRDAGIGWERARVRTLPGYLAENYAAGSEEGATRNTAMVSMAERIPPGDRGRMEVTGKADDIFRYRTPSLRNIALTAPYFHDGSRKTLREVVNYYAMGGFRTYGIDQMIVPLDLTWDERTDLVEFLESLTSTQIPALVAEARAPVGGQE